MPADYRAASCAACEDGGAVCPPEHMDTRRFRCGDCRRARIACPDEHQEARVIMVVGGDSYFNQVRFGSGRVRMGDSGVSLLTVRAHGSLWRLPTHCACIWVTLAAPYSLCVRSGDSGGSLLTLSSAQDHLKRQVRLAIEIFEIQHGPKVKAAMLFDASTVHHARAKDARLVSFPQ